MKRRRDFKKRVHKQPKGKFSLFGIIKNINIYKKIDIFKYLSILLIVLFIISIPAVIKRLIKIDKIECSSQFGACSQKFQLGDYGFVKKQIESELLKNIQVNSYIIQYKIPSTIKIELNLKKPKYAIKNINSDYFLIDKNGLVLEIRKDTNLQAVLKNNFDMKVGEVINNKDKFALNIIERVNIISSVANSEIKEDELDIVTSEGTRIKFPLEGDVEVLAGSLRLIFSRLNEGSQGIKMEDVHEVDLRFKNPVIR